MEKAGPEDLDNLLQGQNFRTLGKWSQEKTERGKMEEGIDKEWALQYGFGEKALVSLTCLSSGLL